MLTYKLLKNHAGVMLCGDFTSLSALCDVVHEVNDASTIIRDKEGAFLGLAYDARKAYSGQRQVFKPSQENEQIGIRYGVEILWPVLLVQCRMLRESLGYFNSTKRQQAVAYYLEYVIEAALHSDFGSNAAPLIEYWMHIHPSHPWAEEKLESRGAHFSMWSKAERKAKLVGLLASFDPMYQLYYTQQSEQGDLNLVSPEELDSLDGVEWVDPRW